MSQVVTCEICGNGLEGFTTPCPYCGSPVQHYQGQSIQEAKALHRVINLEKGMPLVKQALERMRNELFIYQKQGVKIITLIHGYGSTGKGGGIRDAVRNDLQFQLHQRRITDVVAGEEFAKKSGKVRNLLRRFPFLVNHRDINRANPGITIVIL